MPRNRQSLPVRNARSYPVGQPMAGSRHRRAMHPDRAALHGHLKGMVTVLENEHMREHPVSPSELSSLRADVRRLDAAVSRLGA